jgi:hypothetical protein
MPAVTHGHAPQASSCGQAGDGAVYDFCKQVVTVLLAAKGSQPSPPSQGQAAGAVNAA